MQTAVKMRSIRSLILFFVLGLAFIFIAVAISYPAYFYFENTEQQSKQNATYWANYVAKLSAEDVYKKNQQGLRKKISHLNSLKHIQSVKIQGDVTTQDSIKLSFDNVNGIKQGDANSNPISQKDIENIGVPYIIGNTIKYVTPISYNGHQVGHILLITSNQEEFAFNRQLIIIVTMLIISFIIIAIVIAVKLENKLTSPLKQMAAEALKIAQTKDYSIRFTPIPYKEIDVLNRNINNFLNRTERHITQLGLAEQNSLKLNIELEDKVTKRTRALKESNQELLSTLEKLHQFQDQLVESEKMASLGDMVAGVAHEVNTPIGLGVTASTLLSDRLDEIKSAFDNKTLKSSQLKKFLSEGEENVGIIYRNLKRAAELISSFKKVAVDQSSEEFREFNFIELFNEVLLTLAPQIKKTPYQIDFDCPAELVVVSKPGPINQVIINLIMNSITHGFENRDHGSITVTVMKLGEQLNISYRDDGKGIDPAIKDKIFEPFTTTKRGEGGSGLGLHLVYNLVTQALGGTIRLDSEPGQGANFEISFPIGEQLL